MGFRFQADRTLARRRTSGRVNNFTRRARARRSRRRRPRAAACRMRGRAPRPAGRRRTRRRPRAARGERAARPGTRARGPRSRGARATGHPRRRARRASRAARRGARRAAGRRRVPARTRPGTRAGPRARAPVARRTSSEITLPDPSQIPFSGASRSSCGIGDSSTKPLPPRHSSASAACGVARLQIQYFITAVPKRRSGLSSSS